jgi:hypothetical protein
MPARLLLAFYIFCVHHIALRMILLSFLVLFFIGRHSCHELTVLLQTGHMSATVYVDLPVSLLLTMFECSQIYAAKYAQKNPAEFLTVFPSKAEANKNISAAMATKIQRDNHLLRLLRDAAINIDCDALKKNSLLTGTSGHVGDSLVVLVTVATG